MENTLAKKQVINGKYEVQFFLEGTDFYEKYRVKGTDNKTYLLKLYNSSKLSRYSFTNEGLLEIEILRQIDHINIISLVESGEVVKNSQKYHLLIFDFISGETLYEKLKRDGVYSPYSAVPMTLNILNAVDELHNHSRTVIHNNINVNNISLDYSKNSEKPVLTGFDSARNINIDGHKRNPTTYAFYNTLSKKYSITIIDMHGLVEKKSYPAAQVIDLSFFLAIIRFLSRFFYKKKWNASMDELESRIYSFYNKNVDLHSIFSNVYIYQYAISFFTRIIINIKKPKLRDPRIEQPVRELTNSKNSKNIQLVSRRHPL